jgi:hypothetical protein
MIMANKRTAWNKGLTATTDERVKRNAESVKQTYNDPNYIHRWKGKRHSKSTIDILKKKCGGPRPGAGRGKSGYYQGIWCDSTWELAWVKYHLDHGIKYEFNDEVHRYYPDFILDGDIYVEIKGYYRDNDYAKWEAFPHELVVIGKVDIMPYLDYCKEVNRSLELLYDEPCARIGICSHCGKEFIETFYNQKTCNSICARNKSLENLCVGWKSHGKSPSKYQLLFDVSKNNIESVGKLYGVSGNSVRKWLKKYEIPTKRSELKSYLIVNGFEYDVPIKWNGHIPSVPKKGSANCATSLTESQVIELRRLYELGEIKSYSHAASIYDIGKSTVASIIKRKTWTHI